MKIDRTAVYEKYGKRCGYCGTELALKDMQVDHIIPKRLENPQGFDSYLCYGDKVHHFDNLMPSCRLCNHYKRGNGIKGFRELMITLHARIEKIYIARVAIKHGILQLKPFSGQFYYEQLNNQNN